MTGKFYARLGVIGGFLALVLAGCTKTGSSSTSTPVTYVSVMNMAPYAPTADIYLNGSLASQSGGIAPGKYSLQYGPLQPGSYSVQFKKTGADSLMAQLPASVFDTSGFYTLLLYNNAGSTQAQAAKIKDDFSMTTATNANYRFFNLSPDAPLVDLYLNNTLTLSYRSTADNIYDPSLNAFLSLAPTSYNIKVKVAGKDSVLASADVTLLQGGVYTLFLAGKSNNLSVNVLQAAY